MHTTRCAVLNYMFVTRFMPMLGHSSVCARAFVFTILCLRTIPTPVYTSPHLAIGLKQIFFISLFVTSVLGCNATAVRRVDGFPSINSPESVLTHIGTRSQSLSQLKARRFTNARRLYEGLPLNPPKRHRWHVAYPVPSGTPGGYGEV
ncbi:hypothetical protein BDQ12DRAFT_303934 [Crucibulum laeve]|uniref:Uncharacterized protein n=1 Tax=Crucibulum laeve TaxID=68775 RepID=A0A5C3M3K3_9AGAR|nr:hypothetical protein BDQ12DRAFT_303934 [Crucibulum laeve]